jgi:hypothetical protein
MTLRSMSGALIASVLTFGLSIAPAHAQRDASLLPPDQSGVITVAGCLQMGGKDGDKFILAQPQLGPVANAATETCNATIDHRALEVEDADDNGINQSMVGRWVEINGKLERETSDNPENLRELSVRSFRLVPVAPPRAEAIAPAPVPVPVETPAPPVPVATTGQVEPTLPRTASPVAAIGLLGLLSLAGGLGFLAFRSNKLG